MEDMSPNEEAAFFGAPSLATPERRLKHWLMHQTTHTALPDDVQALLTRVDELQEENERLRKALEDAVFGLEATDVCLRSWNNLGGPVDVERILTQAHQALEPRHD